MRIPHIADRLLRRLLELPPPHVHVSLLNRALKVHLGSLTPGKVDYDDAWLLACALHARDVFDIGANVGTSSLMILLSPSVQNVLLVDPNPDALAIAAANLVHNGLVDNARFVCAFVSDKADEQIAFWTVGTGRAGSMYSSHADSARRQNSSMTVQTTTVDALYERYGIIPDLVKIDVEGAERLVLAGAAACAAHHKTRFFIEVHSNPDLTMTQNAQHLLDWCAAHGYSAWFLKEKIRLTSPEPVAHRGRCHWLIQPASWEFPDWLLPLEESAPLEKALASAS
ncbi:MAG: FkbM family methyltransferase [Anaerolineae bacterium]|nr:FkbM family methyltransferase [Anaerolineae bacterium]